MTRSCSPAEPQGNHRPSEGSWREDVGIFSSVRRRTKQDHHHVMYDKGPRASRSPVGLKTWGYNSSPPRFPRPRLPATGFDGAQRRVRWSPAVMPNEDSALRMIPGRSSAAKLFSTPKYSSKQLSAETAGPGQSSESLHGRFGPLAEMRPEQRQTG